MPTPDELYDEIKRIRDHVHNLRNDMASLRLKVSGLDHDVQTNAEAWKEIRPLVRQLSNEVEAAGEHVRIAAEVAKALQSRGPVVPMRWIVSAVGLMGGIVGLLVGLHQLGV